MATIAGLSLSAPAVVLAKSSDSQRHQAVKSPFLNQRWRRPTQYRSNRRVLVGPVAASPNDMTDKVAESVKNAEQACSDDPAGGECVAAWDEVEELSAEASHQRDKQKQSDPLEDYCKDNPETDECRTYDN